MKWNFCPLFYSRKLKSMLHWFIFFEFKLWSGTQNNFSLPPKLAKNAVVVFWALELKWRQKVCKFRLLHFESVYFLQSWHSLSRLFGGFIQWKMSSNDELSSDKSSSCDAESLQLAVEVEGSFNSIVQRYRGGSWKKETWRRRRDGGNRGRRRWYTPCDLRISIWKQGNSLELVNYKSAMPSM